jgi:hypothetical protein
MEGAHDALTPVSVVSRPATRRPARRQRGRRLLGPVLATGLLVAASLALAPRAGLAFWALLPVAVVAMIVTGLLGALVDAPRGTFERRLSAYAAVMGWVWRALALYAVGLALFFGTIWLFS